MQRQHRDAFKERKIKGQPLTWGKRNAAKKEIVEKVD